MPETNGSAARYGIYFSPSEGSRLHELGSRWLGRDAVTGKARDPGLPGAMPHDEWLRATQSPRRYGFHATLKPPFRLAEGAKYEDLQAALRDFAAGHKEFEAPPLTVGTLGHFLALTLSQPSEGFARLADDAVCGFERFRAPATESELAQRLRDSLSAHDLAALAEYLRGRFAPACSEPLLVDSVCIFLEPSPGAPFRVVDRARLRSL